jgi:hypothetical protein
MTGGGSKEASDGMCLFIIGAILMALSILGGLSIG